MSMDFFFNSFSVQKWAKDAGEVLRDFFNSKTKFVELQEVSVVLFAFF